ncbi:MAG: hypothetical protein LBD95_00550, partial [Clostridiales Family XIII bacterium]|nr:hypothetical protein [Clostridiales Family XIII bacterium]
TRIYCYHKAERGDGQGLSEKNASFVTDRFSSIPVDVRRKGRGVCARCGGRKERGPGIPQ